MSRPTSAAEETTGTLFRGDLFTQLGAGAAVVGDDLTEPAQVAEDAFGQTGLGRRVTRPGLGR